MFGRLVLIPFIDGEKCPNGVEEQQKAESKFEQMLERGSSAIGTMIAVSEDAEYLCQTRAKAIRVAMEQDMPDIDGRCMKNYALLISFAEKVTYIAITLIYYYFQTFFPALGNHRSDSTGVFQKLHNHSTSLTSGPIITRVLNYTQLIKCNTLKVSPVLTQR